MWVLIFGVMSTVSALTNDGPCPDVKVVEDFDLNKMRPGPWYQSARYPNDIEKKGNCVTMGYKVDGAKKIYINEIVDGKLEEFSGFIDYDKNFQEKGKLMLYSSNFTESEDSKMFPLHILYIDYDSYYIGYSCSYDKAQNKRNEYLWLTSLTNKLPEEAKASFHKFIQDTNFIDESKLIWDHFDLENCKIDN